MKWKMLLFWFEMQKLRLPKEFLALRERKGIILPLPMCVRKLMRAHSTFDCDFVHQIIALQRCVYAGLLSIFIAAAVAVKWACTESVRAGEFLCLLFRKKREIHNGHSSTVSARSLAIFIYTQHCERAKTVSTIWIHDVRQAVRQSHTEG